MPIPYLGQITMFAGGFAPRHWAFCDGQLVSIGVNTALFSLVGTIYGGDGRTTFALPDLRGRVPVHHGEVKGLRPWSLGSKAGTEAEELSLGKIPSHRHPMQASAHNDDASDPYGRTLGVDADESYTEKPNDLRTLNPVAVASIGGGRAHSNMGPYLGINFIIAMEGVYPSRH